MTFKIKRHMHARVIFRCLVVNSDIKTPRYLIDVTLKGAVNHNILLGVQVYDGVGRTWIRERIALSAGNTNMVYMCTPRDHANKGFEITTPLDFDLVYTVFQPLMCTSDFRV